MDPISGYHCYCCLILRGSCSFISVPVIYYVPTREPFQYFESTPNSLYPHRGIFGFPQIQCRSEPQPLASSARDVPEGHHVEVPGLRSWRTDYTVAPEWLNPLLDPPTYIQKQQIKWFGHLVRMQENQLPSQALHKRKSGAMAIGRARRKWIDIFKEPIHTHNMTVVSASHQALDRKLFLPTTLNGRSG